jgi:hypothetical protein
MNTIVVNGNCHALPNAEIQATVEALSDETLKRRLDNLAAWNHSGRTWENAGPFQDYVELLLNQEYYLHYEKARRACSVDGGGI